MADTAPFDNVNPRQQKALLALLNEPSIRQAAHASGIPEKTLYNWLKDATFKAAYAAMRRDLLDQALSRLQQYSGAAVTVLAQTMSNPKTPPATRVAAAKAILDMARDWLTTEDMLKRLEALEAAHAEKHQ